MTIRRVQLMRYSTCLMLSTALVVGIVVPSLRGGDKPQETAKPRVDQQGDPLPPGALARLGSIRFRQGSFIQSLAVSPDGKVMASAGAGGKIRLWDAAMGKELHFLSARVDTFLALVFSPAGKT